MKSSNVRSFLTLNSHILCQKQKASLGHLSPELKMVSVPECVLRMPLTIAKMLLPQITSFPGYMNSEIPAEQAFIEWCIDLREVDAA